MADLRDEQWWRDYKPREIERLREMLKGHAEAPYLEALVAYWAESPQDPEAEPVPDDGMDGTTAYLVGRSILSLHMFAESGGPASERQFKRYSDGRLALEERLASKMTVAEQATSKLIFPEGL
jgi:hypothetical protein